MPAYRSRRERFDRLALSLVAEITRHIPEVAHVEFAVEDVPPSAPAPWEEHAVVFGRMFRAERHLPARIVLYRLPIQGRCRAEAELRETLEWVLVENLSGLLCMPPEDLAPPEWRLF